MALWNKAPQEPPAAGLAGRGCAAHGGCAAAEPPPPRSRAGSGGERGAPARPLRAAARGPGAGKGSGPGCAGGRRRAAGMVCGKQMCSLQTEAAEADGAGGLREERGAVGEPRTGGAGNIPSTGGFSHFFLKDVSRCLAPEAGALEHP